MNEIHTPELQQLVVTRDGAIDHDHYAAMRREELKQALREVGGKALKTALHTPAVVGKGILWVINHEPQNDYSFTR